MEALLFQMNRDNSGNSQLICFCLTNVLCLLPDYVKEEIIWSINLINGFSPRGYSIKVKSSQSQVIFIHKPLQVKVTSAQKLKIHQIH